MYAMSDPTVWCLNRNKRDVCILWNNVNGTGLETAKTTCCKNEGWKMNKNITRLVATGVDEEKGLKTNYMERRHLPNCKNQWEPSTIRKKKQQTYQTCIKYLLLTGLII